MARALSAEEKVRYPWASQITDYLPVGQWRRYGLLCAVAGICVLGLGVLVIYVIGWRVGLNGGVPHGTGVWIVVALSTALMAAGFFIGLVTTVTAWMRHSRSALFWSTSAMVPGLLWLAIWLMLR
jgi:hypothetical protein